MDDNIWEYPFGDIDEDDDMYFRKPDGSENRMVERKRSALPLIF